MIKLHPSSVGKIMSNPTAAAMKEGEVLSVGAKTYLNGLAKQEVYGYRPDLNTKPIQKGRLCEQDSIDLLNALFFTDHAKNTERREDDILTGEADIVAEDCIIDVKTPWSLDTFPATPEDGENTDYEWQLRAYMRLWDKPRATIAYCLVSTPDHLCQYESPLVHLIDHLPINMRVTLMHFTRDAELEARMVAKCKAAQLYVLDQIERIKRAHLY